MQELLYECYEFEVLMRGRALQATEETAQIISKVARWITDPKTKPSLLLFGGVGNGKTTTAKAIRRAISGLGKVARGQTTIEGNIQVGVPFSSIQTPAYYSAQTIVDNMSSDESVARGLLNSQMIIIDDLGCEPVSAKSYGTEVTPVLDVIRARYDTMLSTVATSNLDLQGIEDRYGLRILDRIVETFELIAFDNKSYRR